MPTALAPSVAAAPTPAIVVSGLTVAYRDTPVLRDIDLTLPAGSLIAVVGPNGAGKSTLVKAIVDVVPRAAGTVEVFGQPYRQHRRRVGYVPQRTSVDWDFPTTVLDVVTMGTYGRLGWLRRPGRHERELARACLEQLGMAGFAGRQISELSGGQQQRVFLARALAQDAELYLMDEPFAGVDAVTETAIVELLRALRHEGRTVLCVHHDLESAPDYFDWVVMLNGRLVAEGPMEPTFTVENLRETYGGVVSAALRRADREASGRLVPGPAGS
ncbi:MAG: ATP-binding cassette domain-containing protein [Acidimicrobiia bacterium]|nr:ATP-binding cassette domain-containing protein [Acidimicrobiia bacterium]